MSSQPKDGDESEHPTEYPGSDRPRAGTATHAPVAQAGFTDPTESAFATTRKVSVEALRALVQARHGSAQDSKASLPPVSPEFLERLQRIRRQGMDAAGFAFGRYTVFGTIGMGGMAEIRLAAEALEGGVRLAVIKSLLPEHANSEAHRALMVEEGRICACLHHPNVVSLYDAGEVDGIPYLAFELVDGLSLRDLLRLLEPARLPMSCILDLGAQAAAALAHAHAAVAADGRPLNVVHRDVTPHNVLLTRHGEVKLVDFGIARFSGRGLETQHGQLRGKLGYMAPEQCRPGPIDGRADVFALGLTLAELVSGRRVLPPTLMILKESESLIRAACADAVEPVPEAFE
ncbi:MAG: serine/threonine protein kinase, partial [Myxococcales bacterium]|nr:serine/threonine protein kinase [Myxococcales bacterium]